MTEETLVSWKGSDNLSSPTTFDGNSVTRSLSSYTAPDFLNIGRAGTVNFRLTYTPLIVSGDGLNPWNAYNNDSAFNLANAGMPEWVIRNGVNDAAQNAGTSFAVGTDWANGANGNGGVTFKPAAATTGNSEGSTLALTNGKFIGPANATNPAIGYTPAGWASGNAEVYYYTTVKGGTAPDFSQYTKVDTVSYANAGQPRTTTIAVPLANGNYDAHVFLYKDGYISDEIIINTASGGIGFEVYF
jgi:hypothetical protein